MSKTDIRVLLPKKIIPYLSPPFILLSKKLHLLQFSVINCLNDGERAKVLTSGRAAGKKMTYDRAFRVTQRERNDIKKDRSGARRR